jgi:signal transduction histidine kinase
LTDAIREYFSLHPKPHVQKIGNVLERELRRINPSKQIGFHVFFIPILYLNNKYLILAFPRSPGLETIPESLTSDLSDIIVAVDSLVQYEKQRDFFHTLQIYVKEVGHDISSSVQATIAKLRNIRRGIVEGEIVKLKAKEVEDEILGIYRIAENLGITVDPGYNIQKGKYFDIIKIAEKVIEQYRSEARERNITIRFIKSEAEIIVWGDDVGIGSAIGQLLFNAIKYAFGSSYIKIKLTKKSEDVQVTVIDRGIPLDDDERDKIWDFGYRGKNAYEMHVNGAGIGLYTVKKIVSAHRGRVFALPSRQSSKVVIFSFTIPIEDILQKRKLL